MSFRRRLGYARKVLPGVIWQGLHPVPRGPVHQARIHVRGRPDWLFIKLHCHGMDPTQKEELLGDPMRRFLQELVDGARERSETLHFATAREMTNIILAACDGREGNPGDYRDYRDYRFKRFVERALSAGKESSAVGVRG